MPFFKDLIYGREQETIDTFITTLSYVPVVGDIIAGVQLTQDIIDQIKNGGETRQEWLDALSFVPYVGDVIDGVVMTKDIVELVMSETDGQARYIYEGADTNSQNDQYEGYPEGTVATYDDGTCPDGYIVGPDAYSLEKNVCLVDDGRHRTRALFGSCANNEGYILEYGYCTQDTPPKEIEISEPDYQRPVGEKKRNQDCRRLCQSFASGSCTVPGCESFKYEKRTEDEKDNTVFDQLEQFRSVCCLK